MTARALPTSEGAIYWTGWSPTVRARLAPHKLTETEGCAAMRWDVMLGFPSLFTLMCNGRPYKAASASARKEGGSRPVASFSHFHIWRKESLTASAWPRSPHAKLMPLAPG